MSFSVTGTLQSVFPMQQITDRFQKREFVVELADNPKYPQFVLFQLTGDRCSKIDGIQSGTPVTVEFRLRGREWTSPQGEVKYFNSLDVWTVEVHAMDAGAGAVTPVPVEGDDDGIPF